MKLSADDIKILELEKDMLDIYAGMNRANSNELREALHKKVVKLGNEQGCMIFNQKGEFRKDKLHLTKNGHIDICLLDRV